MSLLQLLFNFPFLLAGFTIKTLFFIRKGLGRDYLKGLAQGFGKCFRQGPGKRYKGFTRIIPRLFKIELLLIKNMFIW